MGFEFGSWTVSTDWTRYTVYQPAGRSGIGKQMTRSFSPKPAYRRLVWSGWSNVIPSHLSPKPQSRFPKSSLAALSPAVVDCCRYHRLAAAASFDWRIVLPRRGDEKKFWQPLSKSSLLSAASHHRHLHLPPTSSCHQHFLYPPAQSPCWCLAPPLTTTSASHRIIAGGSICQIDVVVVSLPAAAVNLKPVIFSN